MVTLLAQMRHFRIETKRLWPVYSKHGDSGEFVLLEGVKGGRESLRFMPPLVIYDDHGAYTAQMQEVFKSLCEIPARADG
jgi:tRNA1(Val) A37 N6-methylase TrmN6